MQAFNEVTVRSPNEQSATWQPVASALTRVMAGIEVQPPHLGPVPSVNDPENPFTPAQEQNWMAQISGGGSEKSGPDQPQRSAA